MDAVMDFLGQALPFVLAGFVAAIIGTFFGNRKR